MDTWLTHYRCGDYLPIPGPLHPDRIDSRLKEIATIAHVAIELIRTRWGDRSAMHHQLRALPGDETNGFDPTSLAYNETDFWLGSLIAFLTRLLRVPEQTLDDVSTRLSDALAGFSLRKLRVHVSVAQLTRLLSLPVWRKRHELYAVWIATQIVHAVSDHDCRFHPIDGCLAFEFKETKLATVVSARPPVSIYSERRTDLPSGTKAAGAGRVGAVQPDYTLWDRQGAYDRCGLVVEVKHYKKNAPGAFEHVFIDYAAAHPAAEIVLVSHGPANVPMAHHPNIAARCHVIGELTARSQTQKDRLRQLVRQFIGKPTFSVSPKSVRLVAMDISMSMQAILESPGFQQRCQSLIFERDSQVALIDNQLRELCLPTEAGYKIATTSRGTSTDLVGPLDEMVGAYEEILVLTDEDGERQLESQFTCSSSREQIDGHYLHIVRVTD